MQPVFACKKSHPSLKRRFLRPKRRQYIPMGLIFLSTLPSKEWTSNRFQISLTSRCWRQYQLMTELAALAEKSGKNANESNNSYNNSCTI